MRNRYPTDEAGPRVLARISRCVLNKLVFLLYTLEDTMKLSDYSLSTLKEFVTGDSKLTPYLSGPQLVKLFNKYGFRDIYSFDSGGLPAKMSRNEYALSRMKGINGTKKLKELIECLVDDRNYISLELDNEVAANKINEIIKYDGFKLERIDDLYVVVGDVVYEDEVEVEVHFEEIQSQIIEQIREAKFIIWIAVAWFTDKKLFNEVLRKKNEGLNIQVIVIDDQINANADFDLESCFETYKVPKKGYFENIMHNKFCVIDLKTVIHGSYNWTNKAKYNMETISIETSRELAEMFARQFIQLKNEV